MAISSTIGKGIMSAYILYQCSRAPMSGYAIMRKSRDALMASWSAGSFYPMINGLCKNGMLNKVKTGGKRLAYEYTTTAKGRAYLSQISSYFKDRETRAFFEFMMGGGKNER
jgi:DNA-binding PadR family transcriptional regulator